MNTNIAARKQNLKIALIAALALGAATVGGTASAANNASAQGSATIVAPIAIVKATDLSFGSVIPGATAGTVSVNTDNARTFAGGVVLTTGAAATAAKFDITGQASSTYTIAYDTGVTLTGPGAAMALTQVSDLTAAGGASSTVASGTLSAGGTQSLYIGGTLAVAANQVAGSYSGSFTATVNYN